MTLEQFGELVQTWVLTVWRSIGVLALVYIEVVEVHSPQCLPGTSSAWRLSFLWQMLTWCCPLQLEHLGLNGNFIPCENIKHLPVFCNCCFRVSTSVITLHEDDWWFWSQYTQEMTDPFVNKDVAVSWPSLRTCFFISLVGTSEPALSPPQQLSSGHPSSSSHLQKPFCWTT